MGYLHGSESRVYHPISAEVAEQNRLWAIQDEIDTVNVAIDAVTRTLPLMVGKFVSERTAQAILKMAQDGRISPCDLDSLAFELRLQEMTLAEHIAAWMKSKNTLEVKRIQIKRTTAHYEKLVVNVDAETCASILCAISTMKI